MQIRFTIPSCLILLNVLFPLSVKSTNSSPLFAKNGINIEDCSKDVKPNFTFNCISFSFIPPDLTLQCGQPPAQVAPIAIDTCCASPSITYAFTDEMIGSGCTYQIIRTWTAVSACGNSASIQQTITFVDSAPPSFVIDHPMFGLENEGDTLSVPCDFNLFLGGGAVSVTDNCDPSPSVTIFDEIQNGNCLLDGYVKLLFCYWIAEDFCGNRDTFSIYVRFIDTIPPQIQCPPDIEIQCELAGDTSLTGSPVIQENCATVDVTYTDDTLIVDACNKVITRNWRVTDACGFQDLCQQKITLKDDSPPSVECPVDILIDCNETADPSSTGQLTASDNCSFVTIFYFDDTSIVSSCELIIKRSWTAEDACGNTQSCTQQIHSIDMTPPQITCPPDKTIECDAPAEPLLTGMATAEDNCGQNMDLTFTDDSVQITPCDLVITRTWTATDDCGNAGSCSQLITLSDFSPPEITCPEDITIECGQSTDPSHTGAASGTDNCDSDLNFSFVDETIQVSVCTSIIKRTWAATDACGNVSICVQTIFFTDTISPNIICPPDISLQCDASSEPASTGIPGITDNCDAQISSNFQDAIFQPDNCTTLIHRTWTATDNCGNQSSCLQTITLLDTTATTISCPPDLTIDCNSSTDPGLTGKPLTNANCDPTPELTFADDSTQLNDCELLITRNWTSTDACGNSSSCIQHITVANISPPEISCPADMTIECDAIADPLITGFATATDACTGVLEIIFLDEISDSNSCLMAIKRLWTATDICGNTATCIQTIKLLDSIPPAIICPPDVTLNCGQSSDPASTGLAKATDNCDGDPLIAYTDEVSNPNACDPVILRKWQATDLCGNPAECTQTIHLTDIEDPVIVCPPDLTMECGASIDPSDTAGKPFASDDCDTELVVSFGDETIIIDDCESAIHRTWTAEDNCGNQVSCVQIITLIDLSPPILTPVNPMIANLVNQDTIDMSCNNLNQLGAADVAAADICDLNPSVQFSESTEITDCTIDGVQVILTCRWTATDACGNRDTFTLIVRIIDNMPPELIGIPEDTLLACASIPPPPAVIAKDACDGNPVLEFNEFPDTTDPFNCKLIREWTATDQCGNTTVQSQVISVIDCDSCFSPNFVNFENFFVETIENRQVLLRWDFPKIGHQHLFAIQRSADNVLFNDIGVVEGFVHFGEGTDHYLFHDKQARAGNNFYRIKSINATNRSVYSDVINAKFEEVHSTLALLYPNPVRGEATLEFVEKLEKELQLKLTNRFGQILLHKSIPAETVLETIDLKDFPAGIYFVILLQKGKKPATYKLVKMN